MNRMWVLLGVAALAGVACLGVGCKPGEPLAGFTADPTSGVAPLKVQFTDRSVVTRESTIAGWSWTFGDGGTSTEQHPEHTYAAAGNYTVSLTVTSSYGKTNVVTLAEYVKVVPAGEPPLPVPNVVGMVQADAEAAITGAGLVVGTVTEAHHATVPAGNIISQNPAAGVEVASGSAVGLVVSRGPQPVAVPDVVDMARVAAEAAITAAGLTVGTVTEEFSITIPAGLVISQNPAAGASVAPGTAVNLVVSRGPEMVTVPNVVGMTQSAAQVGITGSGLVVGAVTEQYHATVPAGQVLSQNPVSGTSVATGGAVALVVSRGPEMVTVPNVVGMTQSEAQTAITGAGLVVGAVTEQRHAMVPAGQVISQNPAAGANVTAGSAVALVVSLGPEMVTVPNAVGMTESEAQTAITGAGFVVGTVTEQYHATVPAGQVISQNPVAGAEAVSGVAVNIMVSRGPWGGGVTVTILLPGDVPLELVQIPAGSFQMGAPDTERSRRDSGEGPVHPVTIGYDFYMGKYEVTQGQWLAVMTTSPGGYAWSDGSGSDYPAYYVSWEDAQAFITALNAHITATGQGPAMLRLPSEAEWEYACRAGTQTRFYFGDSLGVGDDCEDDGVRSQYMWYCGNNTGSEGQPGYGSKPVGGKLPNDFGLYDMSGNVWEWCEDWWHGDYTGAPTDGSAWVVPSASNRVLRGGFWDTWAQYCRSAVRDLNPPSIRSGGTGFRLVSVQGEGEPFQVTVPNVVGMTQITAHSAIFGAGLLVGTVTQQHHATIPAGQVISQNPASGASVASGSTVALVVSLGPETVTVPDVVGMTQSEAQTATTGAGLVVGTVAEQYNAMVPAGEVISQTPASGAEVVLGSAVDIVVSCGPWDGDDTVTILLPGNVPLELVRIPAGSFQMGSPDTERNRYSAEGPVHTVTIGYDFYMGKYEVTQGQWLAVMGTSPGGYTWDYGSGSYYPAYNVSWDDAQAFITAVNAHITTTGQGPATLRLPSEAEWEYACRAGTQTRFHFGDSLGVDDYCEDDGERSQYMWYCENNTTSGTKPVGGLLPNGFGLHDMSGNLWEWCEDWWHDDYTGAPADGSAWVSSTASYRVIRGGHWNDYAQSCRSARRGNDYPSYRNRHMGFRLASVR